MITLFVWSTSAQEVAPILVPASHPYTGGSAGIVWLYYLNQSSSEVRWAPPAELHGTLSADASVFSVSLTLTAGGSPSHIVSPGGFAKQEYQLEIPSMITGEARLSVGNYTPIFINVESPATTESAAEQAKTKQPAGPEPMSGAAIVHFLDQHLTAYEPIYFLLGTYPAAEFQFSLKFKVFNSQGPVNPLAHFYFAYTQTSFWDLLTRDPSFFDTSYKPSVFLLYSNLVEHERFRLDLQGGIEHESNGRGGTAERSLYTTYLQPTARLDLADRWQFAVQPRAWTYVSTGSNNPDLPDYRGYADLRTSLTWFYNEDRKRIQLANQLRIGDEGRHPGVTIDLRLDLPGWANLNPTIQVQYFTGYGQTLRQYNEYSHGFRAGLCLHY